MHTPETLLTALKAMAIEPVVYHHHAHHTVEDGLEEVKSWPAGAHIKNLFVKDKAGNLTLITCLAARRVDLVGLGKHLGSKDRWSFAKEDVMVEVLGVRPGAVTPLALINVPPGRLQFVWDTGIEAHDIGYPHPLINTQTYGMKVADILHAVQAWGHTPVRIDLGQFAKA